MSTQATKVDSLRRLNEQLWTEQINLLVGMNLPGLRVTCPECGKAGIPGTKWVRGLKTKPLYVFHQNGNREPQSCLLANGQAEAIRKQVMLGEPDIAALLGRGKPYVLFSGGLDSLCALDYMARLSGRVGRTVTALHINTTIGLDEVTAHVEKTCRELGVELQTVRPSMDYFTLARSWGIPGVNSRWCCRELKIRPVTEFLASVKEAKIVFDGIRAAESGIRAKYLPVWFHPSFNCLSVSAIFGWTDRQVKDYVEQRNLPTGLASELGTSGECWCGAYKRKEDFKKLYDLNRGVFHKLCEVEDSNAHGFTFIYERGERLALRELATQIEANRVAVPEGGQPSPATSA